MASRCAPQAVFQNARTYAKGGLPDSTGRPPSKHTGILRHRKNKRESLRNDNDANSRLQELEQNALYRKARESSASEQATNDINKDIANTAITQSYETLKQLPTDTNQAVDAALRRKHPQADILKSLYTVASACSKSANRSSVDSMPQLKRTISGEIPQATSSSSFIWRCVALAGCSTHVRASATCVAI